MALSQRLTRHVATMPLEGADDGYGIDILIACETAAAGLPFCTVDLGLKAHRARGRRRR
jgi:hypothetical protein